MNHEEYEKSLVQIALVLAARKDTTTNEEVSNGAKAIMANLGILQLWDGGTLHRIGAKVNVSLNGMLYTECTVLKHEAYGQMVCCVVSFPKEAGFDDLPIPVNCIVAAQKPRNRRFND